MRFLLSSAAFFTLLAFTQTAAACSCEIAGQPCNAYSRNPAVFTGVVMSVSEVTVSEGSYSRKMRQFRFFVNERFRGAEGAEIEIVTGYGGGDCGYGFRVGERYLVYASEFMGKLSANSCSRTRPMSEAAEDLEFLRGLATAAPGASISGTVMLWSPFKRTALQGVKVTATNEAGRKFETASGVNGNFTLANLEPGEYTIQPQLPSSLTSYGPPSASINVIARGCAETYLFVRTNGRISGRLLSADGSPASKVEVQAFLRPGSEASKQYGSERASSDEQGHFEFNGLQPGEYVLGISLTNPPWSSGYPKSFYPGVQSVESATSFRIEEAKQIPAVEFRLPPKMRRIAVTARVTWTDGTPAANALVIVDDPEYNGPPLRVDADTGGRAIANVFEGREYRIFASVPGRNCNGHSIFTAKEGIALAPVTIDPKSCNTQ